ncbi:MAG: PAS domain S-box protein [Planctomycetota bacterium]
MQRGEVDPLAPELAQAALLAAPVALLAVDERGSIVLANTRSEELLGYPAGALIGLDVEALVPERFRQGHAELRSGYMGMPSARAMGAGRDLFALRRDGREVQVEIGLNPIQTEAGRVVLVAIVDIDARAEFAARLRRQERHLHQAIESAASAMVMVDAAGRIVLINAQTEAIFGYRRAELIGQPVEVLIPDRYRRGHPKLREDYFARPSVRPMGQGRDLFGMRKDGSEVPIEVALSTIETEDGLNVLATIVDISARLELLGRIERSNVELEQFASVASHDLQEPLRKVVAFGRLLHQDCSEQLSRDGLEWLGFMIDAAERMRTLTQDLLTLSRVQSQSIVAEEVETDGVLQEALENLAMAIKDSGAEVTAEPLPRVRADRGHLVQLFQNLIGNGIKYRGEVAPRIRVSVVDTANDWVLSFADNGIGVDPRFHEQIFGVFKRLHAREAYPGTGIGLAICKRIVDRLGGAIAVESAEGHGATFRVTVPKRYRPEAAMSGVRLVQELRKDPRS